MIGAGLYMDFIDYIRDLSAQIPPQQGCRVLKIIEINGQRKKSCMLYSF